MSLINVQVPFFKPLWRRVATVVVCFGWGAFELVGGSAFWGTLFIGLGLICSYEFFVAFNPPDET